MAMFAFGSKRWPGIAKLMEECGEAIQVCGKLIATGGEWKHWDGSDLKRRLEEELADLGAAIDFVVSFCGLDMTAVGARRAEKRARFAAWHQEQAEPSEPSDRVTDNELDGAIGVLAALSDGVVSSLSAGSDSITPTTLLRIATEARSRRQWMRELMGTAVQR